MLGVLALVVGASGLTWALAAQPWQDDQGPGDDEAAPSAGPVNGDLNGDGHGDLLAAYWTETGDDTHVHLFRHHSDGSTFDEVEVSSPEIHRIDQLLLGDFDGEPGAEPYVVRRSPEVRNQVDFVPVDGGTVEFSIRIPEGASFEDAYLGDFTGNGATDVALSYRTADTETEDGTRQIAVWQNSGAYTDRPSFLTAVDGTEEPQVWLDAGDLTTGARTVNVVVGDFDGDGRDDLALVRQGTWDEESEASVRLDSTVQLLLSDAQRFQPVGTPRKVADRGVGAFRAGDFDGDGKDELVVVPGDGAGDPVRVLAAGDDGWLPAALWGTSPVRDTYGVAVADFDGDGTDDIAVLDRELSFETDEHFATIHVLLSERTRFAEAESWLEMEGFQPSALASRHFVHK